MSSGDVTVNDHVNDALERVDDLLTNARRRPDATDSPIVRDLEEARRHLEDGLTRFNSAVYRMNDTWKRADAERIVGWVAD